MAKENKGEREGNKTNKNTEKTCQELFMLNRYKFSKHLYLRVMGKIYET